MNTHIRSTEFAWYGTELKILGRVVTGLRGFELKKTVEKEHLYASGSDPIDIQAGNKQVTGTLTVLGFELDQLNEAASRAGFQDITEVPHEAINLTLSMKKTLADKKTFVTVTGIAFTEYSHAMQQNAKMREVSLPFIAMDMYSITR